MPNNILEKLSKQLTEKRAWDKLHVLYLGGGGPQRYSPGEGGLATGINASDVPIELVFEAGEKYRVPLIVALLEDGAQPNGLQKRKECPLELAMEGEDYHLVVTLLQYNADPACIVTKPGDSLLHEALKQMFATGLLSFLFRLGVRQTRRNRKMFLNIRFPQLLITALLLTKHHIQHLCPLPPPKK